MTKKPQMKELHQISNLETLKVISDPFRMEILRLIGASNLKGHFSTVKELSEELDLPPTKLYYHINLLEKHGLIEIGDTQIVSGIIEKLYQVVAEDITVDKNILATAEGTEDEKLEAMLETFRSLLDGTYQDIKKSLTKAFQDKKERDENAAQGERSFMQATKSDLYLTPQQAKHLAEELKSIETKYDRQSTQNLKENLEIKTYTLALTFAPLHHKNPPKTHKENHTND